MQRHLRYIPPMSRRTCSVDDCSRPHYGKTFCRSHYDRMRWRGTIDDPDFVRNQGRPCAVDDCTRIEHVKGYCGPHYTRLLKRGDAAAGGPIRRRRSHAHVPAGERLCPSCDQSLPIARFANGQHQCRACRRSYYQANKAKLLASTSASNRRSYERAKVEGRCTWRAGRGCQQPMDPGYVHCSEHRTADAARHSREYARHYATHGLTNCWLCEGEFTDFDPLEHDHLIPKSLGGPDDPWNRAPAHRSCNNRRRNAPLRETVTAWHPDGLTESVAALIADALRRFDDGCRGTAIGDAQQD